jgi:hypothetical protein
LRYFVTSHTTHIPLKNILDITLIYRYDLNDLKSLVQGKFTCKMFSDSKEINGQALVAHTSQLLERLRSGRSWF